jgi:hypothetical protein
MSTRGILIVPIWPDVIPDSWELEWENDDEK